MNWFYKKPGHKNMFYFSTKVMNGKIPVLRLKHNILDFPFKV